ncbi:hypothetical protein [Nisaea sediminum]|uniref:hypothetical protein n=1 Tax=Nisaea sediminum TaxID=2775867 RepID=UPI00186848CB|nr:hypothetical protein [Nisaea sediminum]
MSWSATIGDRTFTDANLDGNAYAEEESGFPAIVRAIAEETAALKGVAGLSASPHVPATGSVAFALMAAPPPAWKVGHVLRASSAGDPSHFMVGAITAISGLDVTLSVGFSGGATSRDDWVITYPLFSAFLELSGGTIAGGLKIDGHSLLLNAPPGQYQYVRMMRNDLPFLDFGLDDTPLSDTAGGSLIFLHAFDNTGTWTGRPIEIDRASGEIRTMGVDLQGYALARGNLRGTRMSVEVLGSLGTETVSINADRWNAFTATLDGNATFDFSAIGTGFEYTRKLRLTQGTGGGFEPVWTLGGSAAGVKRIGLQPNYAGQTAGTVTRVTAEVWDNELRLWETEES